ncbi:MAG: DUF2798 domain-containing protein [Aliiglaciecola sp.]|uniref:DUF2798 domain-containing protein n=1 Tax=Aliiglaciecola sp. TaxID=1872441 RepID=UPI003297A235
MQLKLKNVLVIFTILSTLVAAITAIMTYTNLQPTQSFLNSWINSYIFALVVMLPTGGLIFIAMNKLVELLFSTRTQMQQKLLHGVFMAVVMESVMAMVTTVVNHDYITFAQYSRLMLSSFLYALPIGLGFSCLMVFVIRPKLQRFLAQPTTNNL